VLRAETSVKLSLRIPPTLDSEKALKDLKKLCESDPPYGAEVKFNAGMVGNGWNCPPSEEYLEDSLNRASLNYYGKPALALGEGGSIPLMNVFANAYPKA